MSEQRRRGKYPDELRERAVRMVLEAQRDCGSQWEPISSVADKLGPTPETVRKWVRRCEVDEGRRPGLTSDERERLKRVERENRELRRANEILKSASVFFAAELDGRTR
ncbi:transposase [Candidatus Poriferisodalis sp.]|uniref:transposase n=1 Tax=Candidatus Poriferisodalis sp. TaxID=3101277 RepID=UPI003B01BF52